jgi:hypothetical protein
MSMSDPKSRQLDLFTRRRLEKFVSEHRGQNGELPTLRDLADHGFGEETVKIAIKTNLIEEFYVTLTNGVIVKGYKLSSWRP